MLGHLPLRELLFLTPSIGLSPPFTRKRDISSSNSSFESKFIRRFEFCLPRCSLTSRTAALERSTEGVIIRLGWGDSSRARNDFCLPLIPAEVSSFIALKSESSAGSSHSRRLSLNVWRLTSGFFALSSRRRSDPRLLSV